MNTNEGRNIYGVNYYSQISTTLSSVKVQLNLQICMIYVPRFWKFFNKPIATFCPVQVFNIRVVLIAYSASFCKCICSSFYEFLFYNKMSGSHDIRRLSFFFSISQFLNSPLPFIWTNDTIIHLTVSMSFIKLCTILDSALYATTPIVFSNS